MGFNSTVVVLNDALHEIENDKEFAKKITRAISHLAVNKAPIDISAGFYLKAATVIETHHADMSKLIRVGGNYDTDLGYVGFSSQGDEEILREFAKMMGFRLVRLPRKGEKK